MNYNPNMRAALQAAELRQEFINWLRRDADKLVSAARLLGGDLWENRATYVTDALAYGAEPEELRVELADLHQLLTLEFTDDLDAHETHYFLMVHPDDPRADEARLCAEALDRGLEVMRALAPTLVKEVA